jgi:uncharacterized membrane protein
MIDKELCTLAIMAAVISFLGFVLENIWLAFTKGYVDNRNMTLPFLFGYGLFITSLYLAAGLPEDFALFLPCSVKSKAARYIAYFLFTFLIVSVGEIIVGKFTEWYFGFYYWNYEALPMHITRYTSVPTSTGFSLIITLFMDKCFLPVMYAVEKIPERASLVLALTFTGVLSADFILSFAKMHRTGELNDIWRIYLRIGRRRDTSHAKC